MNEPTYVDPEVLKEKNAPDENGEQPQIAQQPQAATQQNQKPKQKQQRNPLQETLQPPATPGQPPEEPLATKRQMQADMRYTPEMKKDKQIDEKEAEKKVEKIVERSDTLLMKMKTVFPFDLFPNTLSIDANKVTIIDKTFFASETITSILLEEITDVVVMSNFFLATMEITYSHHPLHPLHYKIMNLRKPEAIRAKEIIQGLLVLRISEGIDLSKLKPDEITHELERIGKTHENITAI